MFCTGTKSLNISQEEYIAFHSIDRRLYATLVDVLYRDPVEAIQMMAIWFWLERAVMAFSSMTCRILTLPMEDISVIGDEALFCWACLGDTDILKSSFVLPVSLTCRILQKEISTEFLRKNQKAAIVGINEVIKHVFPKCLKDIWERAVQRNARLAFLQRVAPLGFVADNELARYVQQVQTAPPQKVRLESHQDERTLFVTFSKGYPVTEWEVRNFMNVMFGDCIESLYMDPVTDGGQSLYARIVLTDPCYMNIILQDGVGKYTIHGKHVWMRKYVPKRRGGGGSSSKGSQ